MERLGSWAGQGHGGPAGDRAPTAPPFPVDRRRLLASLPELAAGEAAFLPADPPRLGRVGFWTPGGEPPDLGVTPEEFTVVHPDGPSVRRTRVRAVAVPVEQAVPLLTRGRALGAGGGGRASAGTAFWGAAAVLALSLLARGRVRPERTAGGFDAWRVGPLDAADIERIDALAAAMPPGTRAVAVPATGAAADGLPPAPPAAEPLLRAFLDAVADALTRMPAGPHLGGGPAPAVATPQRASRPGAEPVPRVPRTLRASVPGPVPEQPRAREDEAAADRDPGLEVSLRVEWAGEDTPGGDTAGGERGNDGNATATGGAGAAGGPREAGRSGEQGDAGGGGGRGDAGGGGGQDVGGGDGRGDAGGGAFRAVVQLRSRADPSVLADAADLWAGTAAAPALFGPRARSDTRQALRRAVRVWPPAARLLAADVPTALELSDEEARALLGGAAERLAATGVAVHWPGQLVRELTATGVLEPARTSADEDTGTTSPATSLLSSGTLLDFRWRVAAGEHELTPEELELLIHAHRPVLRLRDQWVVVDSELVRRLRKTSRTGPRSLTPIDALGAALTGTVEVDGEQVEVTAGGALEELRARITDPESRAAREPHGPPRELTATLRDYQVRGLNWLHRMTSLGLGACLADDMGLGKTVTLISLHLRRQEREATAGPTLVVCPASLLGNWEREIRRFAPTAPVRRFHGPGRELASGHGELGGFVLTTYGTMRRDAGVLAERPWGLLVADEAQHVKNPHTHTAQALRRIPSGGRVALTGTPVENNLSELWALLDWTTPGLLGTLGSFRDRYAKAVEGDRDARAARELAALVAPFLLRRRKSDPGVVPELPAKTETDHPVSLTREQVSLYESLVRRLMAEIEEADGMARRGLVTKLLTGLKQVCNHPAQFLKEPATTKLRGRSGKLALLDELLDGVLAGGGSALVFTQYVAMGRLIERHLAGRGVGTLFLHGGTAVKRRVEMVDAFQTGEKRVFLLSLKAAGTGLNLTRADHVVHYDRWWNPAVEDQATDRAHRIGQTRAVQVHKLVTEGTVEERVAEMLARKRELVDAVLGSGEGAFSELTDGELAALVTLRGSRR